MGSIKFNKQNGRLKRQLPGEDHYSGLIFYSAAVPTGFATDAVIEVNDLEHAEELGITSDNASNDIKNMHYHISECFRANKDIVLWVGVFAPPAEAAEHTFAEISTLRLVSQNRVRRVGVFTKKAYAAAQMALLQDQYVLGFDVKSGFEIFYSPNFHGVTTVSLPSLATLAAPNVHLLIGQDGGYTGAALYTAAGFSIGVIGAAIGFSSAAKVHENFGWVQKFDICVRGGELDKPALSNGDLIEDLSEAITKDLGTLDVKRLIFVTKYPNIAGSYFNDSHGACPADSDYAYAEDNMPIDKAIRGIYRNMMPFVNGPTLLEKGTGKLRASTVDLLQLEAGKALEQMEKDGELSGYEVLIDPDQDVAATSSITINISNTKVGVSRRFNINIGY
ncbi:DUF2586 family protein [Niabella sp. 22666]|uniref:DUF2586 family protein n=1 Tax=Niabella sp. 22666 TaxID=3453954 RepID=UPI003F866821